MSGGSVRLNPTFSGRRISSSKWDGTITLSATGGQQAKPMLKALCSRSLVTARFGFAVAQVLADPTVKRAVLAARLRAAGGKDEE